ncbi:diguanylate cyclase [Saccharibacillus sp. CPCC 101409]|uniref:diguanylate cyclase n=1 Tax=Saccharibacillus sp. CPCC 101409 TaxID=3058041 RepID=UPI002672F17C|nr:diguanylate cyclase [Saccharibacillus sp. CPCC 101409]MDO3408319.1 diguanylate cyclase [Saccharibacillus sp. CPCC 101409]
MKKMMVDVIKGRKFVGSNLVKGNMLFMIIFILNVTVCFGYMTYSLQADYQKVKQTVELRIQLLMLENALIDQETGQRGYLLTAKTEFLEPFDRGALDYQAASIQLLHIVDELNEAEGFEADMKQLIDTGKNWKTGYGDAQIRKVMTGGNVTEAELLAGKQKFDTFRAREADLLAAVEKMRAEQRTEMLNSFYRLFTIMGVVFITIQSVMLFYLHRGLSRFTRPIIQLDEAVSSYKGGNIQAQLPSYSEDNEIGRLVENFKLMHQEMNKEKRVLEDTYRMINILNQARSVEDSYKVTLRSTWSLLPCERLSIITQNPDQTFSIKAVLDKDSVIYKNMPLTGEERDVQDLLQGGFSMIHTDWSQYRAAGRITDQLYRSGIRSSMHIILRKEARIFGVLNFMSLEPNFFTPQSKERIELLSPMIVTALENVSETTRIQDMAMRDGLTGLWNRRYFEQSADKLMARIDRSRGEAPPFGLILLDIDHFKRFNDTWGHQEGDVVLKHLGELLSVCCRPSDIPVRFGGEEFAVLLPNATLPEAQKIAERLRKLLEFESPSHKHFITASFGVAVWDGAQTKQRLIEAADRALYKAKASGRNRVCVWDEEREDYPQDPPQNRIV